jgi:hypothetical protein
MLPKMSKTMQFTTGEAYFAECLRHSAKQHKHSANTLPNVTLGKEETAKKGSAKASLPSVFCQALGKDFAERLILLSAKKMNVTVEETVTDVCQVPKRSTQQKCTLFAECCCRDTRQRLYSLPSVLVQQNVCTLPSAGVETLGKSYALSRVLEQRPSANLMLFAECCSRGTRQRFFFWKRLFSISPKPHTVLQVYNSHTDASNKLIDHKFYKSLMTKLISNEK